MSDDPHPLVTVIKARQLLEDVDCADDLDDHSPRLQTALEELDYIILAEADTLADLLEDAGTEGPDR